MDSSFLNEQIILLATVLGAVASLPVLIEFVIDHRKRGQRLALSVDDVAVESLDVRLAGLDQLLGDIADLIDRAKDPHAYSSLRVGNEILILGPPLSGKKTLAMKIAQEAEIDRLIIVYNARNPDALVRAKALIQRHHSQKVMLLLPRMDLVFEKEDDEVLSELDALIETSSGLSNVLVVGTAVYFQPDSVVDNTFGVKLVLPGTPRDTSSTKSPSPEVRAMLSDIVDHYLSAAAKDQYQLEGLSLPEAREQILSVATNPAEIEDIVVLCQTAALFDARKLNSPHRTITLKILRRAISRVIVNVVSKHG